MAAVTGMYKQLRSQAALIPETALDLARASRLRQQSLCRMPLGLAAQRQHQKGLKLL